MQFTTLGSAHVTEPLNGSAIAETIFANEADPAFRRRAIWIGGNLTARFQGRQFRLLDVGCGRGFYFPLYAAVGARVTGVELDAAALRAAEPRAAAAGAVVLSARAERLPFEDGSFEAVVMSEILEHLDSPQQALDEAFRVLSPDGLLLVTVPNANYPFAWDPINFTLEAMGAGPIRQGPLAGIWANHVRLYETPALSRSVTASGFDIIEVFSHTTRCLPFAHNIIYGLGKPLLEKRLLPGSWARSAERGTGNAGGFNPVRWGITLIRWADRGNGQRARPDQRAQNICLSACKPRCRS